MTANLHKEINMSQQNSIPAIRNELASEYGKYIAAKSNRGFLGFIIKRLIVPLVAVLVILTGAAFALANFAPARYTQVKDILFTKVDLEKLTGRSNSVNKEFLDHWLILNAAKQQDDEKAPQKKLPQEQSTNQSQ